MYDAGDPTNGKRFIAAVIISTNSLATYAILMIFSSTDKPVNNSFQPPIPDGGSLIPESGSTPGTEEPACKLLEPTQIPHEPGPETEDQLEIISPPKKNLTRK